MSPVFGPDVELRFNGASLEYDFDPGSQDRGPGYIATLRIGVAFQEGPSATLKPLDLVGASEIKKMMGVSRQRVQQLASSSDFPTPAASLDGGRIWLRSEVQEWIDLNRSSLAEDLGGRPSPQPKGVVPDGTTRR
jgi:predicted DNA-binding transcriptional regulator AlpA